MKMMNLRKKTKMKKCQNDQVDRKVLQKNPKVPKKKKLKNGPGLKVPENPKALQKKCQNSNCQTATKTLNWMTLATKQKKNEGRQDSKKPAHQLEKEATIRNKQFMPIKYP